MAVDSQKNWNHWWLHLSLASTAYTDSVAATVVRGIHKSPSSKCQLQYETCLTKSNSAMTDCQKCTLFSRRDCLSLILGMIELCTFYGRLLMAVDETVCLPHLWLGHLCRQTTSSQRWTLICRQRSVHNWQYTLPPTVSPPNTFSFSQIPFANWILHYLSGKKNCHYFDDD